jgi:RNA polymerase sigma factor (sigma-70 family)
MSRETGRDPYRLDPAAEAKLTALVRWKIRAWQDHAHYDDMLAEAYYRAWRSYRHGVERGVDDPLEYALTFADRGPIQWLRRWYGHSTRGDARAAATHVAWEDLAGEPEAEVDPGASPEAQALAAIERRALFAWLQRATTPRQWTVLVLLYGREIHASEVARRLGTNAGNISNIHQRAIAAGRIAAEELPSFPRAYPRCPRGHALTPENITRGVERGKPRQRCLLCYRDYYRSYRARKAQNASRKGTEPILARSGPRKGFDAPGRENAP